MNEERNLMERCGKENPFGTPQGYFEALPRQIMNRIHRRQQRRRMIKWAVAAVMTGCLFTAGLTWQLRQTSDALTAEDQYIEDMLDYTMLNNMDINYYLTEAE
ncbi:MAG: hypothetical protein K5945_04945 [Bacteroidaceae bacterium]|nr:hypothetical protein [Bacteroidaceae bacterium]